MNLSGRYRCALPAPPAGEPYRHRKLLHRATTRPPHARAQTRAV